jgi:uncharacterized membrane protein YkvA (DUF1232 family)
MADKNSRTLKTTGGVLEQISLRARLILRLMMDRRISFWLKLLPVGSLIYLVNPIDIPGPIDDIAVVSIGLYLFVDLCPPAIVQEHMNNMRSVVNAAAYDPPADGEVVDAEFHETPPEDADSKS